MKIALNSQRTLNFSKTVEYRFSIDEKDHQLIVFESSGTGVEYWLDGDAVGLKHTVVGDKTLESILLSFEN